MSGSKDSKEIYFKGKIKDYFWDSCEGNFELIGF